MKERAKELGKMSGNITYHDDPLTTFLYLLMRDHLPTGIIEKIVDEIINDPEEVSFTNGWLAQYANNLSEQIMGAKRIRLKQALDSAFVDSVVKPPKYSSFQEAFNAFQKSKTQDESKITIDDLKKDLGDIHGMDEVVLQNLEEKLNEAQQDEDIDHKSIAVEEALTAANQMEASGELSKEEADQVREDLLKDSTDVVIKSAEDMEKMFGLTEEDRAFVKEDILSASKQKPNFPIPTVSNKWKNTIAELDKED